eukprot:TRINITY_DN16011_c0_g1_i1.p1 TRINITY_DN16011_c0_g1~~TRINITY_DN16011_c0_g1_i1.p1  ORF type:complete len:181 (+),score=64.16 TRINITY_DN16011_c0_g1_i1:53-595(+)
MTDTYLFEIGALDLEDQFHSDYLLRVKREEEFKRKKEEAEEFERAKRQALSKQLDTPNSDVKAVKDPFTLLLSSDANHTTGSAAISTSANAGKPILNVKVVPADKKDKASRKDKEKSKSGKDKSKTKQEKDKDKDTTKSKEAEKHMGKDGEKESAGGASVKTPAANPLSLLADYGSDADD